METKSVCHQKSKATQYTLCRIISPTNGYTGFVPQHAPGNVPESIYVQKVKAMHFPQPKYNAGSAYAFKEPVQDLVRVSPYLAPHGHSSQTFMNGYTGFVPGTKNQFGEVCLYRIYDAAFWYHDPSCIRSLFRQGTRCKAPQYHLPKCA